MLAVDTSRRAEASMVERLNTVTPREGEVLHGVARGRLNNPIAFDLGIIEATVELHRGRGMHKMEAASIGELIRICEAAHADARGRRYLEGCWSCDRCQRDPRTRRVDRLRAVRAMQRSRSWCRTQGTQLVQI